MTLLVAIRSAALTLFLLFLGVNWTCESSMSWLYPTTRDVNKFWFYIRLILCTGIRPSIGTENLIPEEVNYSKISIRVTVMNKVQFLVASEPRKPL